MKKTALYLTIAQDIIDQIQAGSLRPGDQLPVEKELCDKYNVSRMTVNKALSSLVYQNYITRTPGKGSFVKCINSDLVKENMMAAIEEYLDKALDKAILGKVSIEELKEMLTLLYEEKMQ